jgi:hypothetical protein
LKKKIHKKRVGGVAQGEGPEFKPQYRKKEEEEKARYGDTGLLFHHSGG